MASPCSAHVYPWPSMTTSLRYCRPEHPVALLLNTQFSIAVEGEVDRGGRGLGTHVRHLHPKAVVETLGTAVDTFHLNDEIMDAGYPAITDIVESSRT